MEIELDGIQYGFDFVKPIGLKAPSERGFMLLKGYSSRLQRHLLPLAVYYWVDVFNKKVYEHIYIGSKGSLIVDNWTDVTCEAVWISFFWAFSRISIQIKRKGEASPDVKVSLEY